MIRTLRPNGTSPRFRRPLLGVPLVVRRIPAEVPLRHRPPSSLTSESMPAEACIPILKGMSGAATLVTQQATLTAMATRRSIEKNYETPYRFHKLRNHYAFCGGVGLLPGCAYRWISGHNKKCE